MAENQLNRTHPDYDDQYSNWEIMDDLYIGAPAVKSASTKYLPMTESEEIDAKKAGSNKRTAYDRRLDNAVYFNGIDRLVKYTTGHMYRENPVYPEEGEAPEWFESMVEDADLLGTELDTFLRNVSLKSYLMGHYFIAVDFPNTSGMDSRSVVKMTNPRPYLVPVSPIEIINWALERTLDGSYQFKWLVHRYSYRESDGPMDDHYTSVYYKVWYKNKWELWVARLETEETDLDSVQPELVEEGPNPLGFIPYQPIYSQMIRPMVSKPPLVESANLNIDHYRVLSAFNHGLMFHLNPILVLSGVQDSHIKTGSNAALVLPRNAKAEYVEYTGRSLNIGKETAEMILREMWESGMRSQTSLGANTSADARRLSRSDFQSWLLSVVSSHENSYNRAMGIAALWARDIPEVEKLIKLNKDFDLTPMDANEAEFLLNTRKAGEISRRVFLKELQRGERLDKTVDIDEEVEAAKADLEEDLKALAEAEAASMKNQNEASADQPEQEPNPDQGSENQRTRSNDDE